MFKTLACLAGAMMGTSALLGWMDPAPVPPVAGIPVREVALLARSLVTDGLTKRAGGWQGVEIAASPPMALPGQFLAASAEADDYHFYVGLDGVPNRATRWTRQEGCDKYPNIVRVEVARRAAGQPMSRCQWLAVRALISSLGETVAAGEPGLPVHLDAEWAETYGLAPGSTVEVPTLDVSNPGTGGE